MLIFSAIMGLLFLSIILYWLNNHIYVTYVRDLHLNLKNPWLWITATLAALSVVSFVLFATEVLNIIVTIHNGLPELQNMSSVTP